MVETTGNTPKRSRAGIGPSGRLCLVVIGEGLDATYPLPDSGKVGIGRGPDAEIRIDHPSVSRNHALLTIGASLVIEDRGSANGTRIRDRWLQAGASSEVALGEPIDARNPYELMSRASASALGQRPSHASPPLVIPNAAIQNLDRIVQRIAGGTISVLVTGETGVGKEVLAERIHKLSRRADKPF